MLLRVVGSVCLYLEVFFELARASFLPGRSIGSALKADAHDLARCGLTSYQRSFVGQLARAVWRLSKVVPFRSKCIHRSVAAFRVLQKRDIPCRLVIAPASEAGQKFIAHAWVELPDNLTVGGAINREMQFKLQSAGPVGERA